MNGGRDSSKKDSWNDMNAALLGVAGKMIDSMSEEGQGQSFHGTVDSGINDDVTCKGVMDILKGVEKTLHRVPVTPS